MRVIVIGSGIAGISFAEKFRALVPDARITLLTREQDGYYSRPMLSRGFSKADIEQSIILKPFDKLLENNICLISGVTVTSINRLSRVITVSGIEDAETMTYDKLILSMGSAAFIPTPLLPFRHLFYLFNSLSDLKALRRFRQPFLELDRAPHWAIIGGGLIGCELASDLAVSGDNVTVFHAMDRLMERQLHKEDSATLMNVLQSCSVRVLLNQSVLGFRKSHDKIIVATDHSGDDAFDAVIVCCGFKARSALAANAGLATNRGIRVNQFLQTSDENIFALGDVAELPNQKLYAYIAPIRNQALWLAAYLSGRERQPWTPPVFHPLAKVHGFTAAQPYIF